MSVIGVTKPGETGRFRSWQEVRCARELGRRGVHWEYEEHVFTLWNGEVYIPDFWLPSLGVFLEVKGIGSGSVSGSGSGGHGSERLHKPWLLAWQLAPEIDVLIKTGSTFWRAAETGWRKCVPVWLGVRGWVEKSAGTEVDGEGGAVGRWRPSAELLSVVRKNMV